MEGYLHLKNGAKYKGTFQTKAVNQTASGEIVFFTGMTGYQEVLTDPSYKDQIIVFTYPLIGNYGINNEDFESKKPHVAGVVVYEANKDAFHYQSQHSLLEYLDKWNIPLISHVDTRAIVKNIRQAGSMPAVLTTEEMPRKEDFSLIKDTKKVAKVSESDLQQYGNGDHHIVLVDFGKKESMVDCLLERGCKVTVVPYNTEFENIQNLAPNGILLSNGPGDPKELKEVLPTVQALIQHYPTLGICLGHQLAALALGAETSKLSFGHRGANHPVMDKKNQKVIMSSQNHSYVVVEDSLKNTGCTARFYNLHDGSVEGLSHDIYPLQTVQFHPEANPGPAEGQYIFDEFIENVKANYGRVFAHA
ncbi:carbamoyl phosphate synthase small subunit [Niallia sp. NCCP-28]|uniref:carbamoyl phosphate synthase small subunit n=1 Tax=Niallia sp. NCCP-28 TaxID=2934712 RepID=UPI00207E63E1|nr:carbamoyl phosphate synthase small subunit [Niallia sp. NCCP-28]GKU81770.1 carbamoyl-phosphate synthase arginine-specific small chain [Niallia sp. NCCP-28]